MVLCNLFSFHRFYSHPSKNPTAPIFPLKNAKLHFVSRTFTKIRVLPSIARLSMKIENKKKSSQNNFVDNLAVVMPTRDLLCKIYMKQNKKISKNFKFALFERTNI